MRIMLKCLFRIFSKEGEGAGRNPSARPPPLHTQTHTPTSALPGCMSNKGEKTKPAAVYHSVENETDGMAKCTIAMLTGGVFVAVPGGRRCPSLSHDPPEPAPPRTLQNRPLEPSRASRTGYPARKQQHDLTRHTRYTQHESR